MRPAPRATPVSGALAAARVWPLPSGSARRRPTMAIVLVAAAIAAVAFAACGPRRASGAVGARKVIVLGFDGLDYELTRRLMADGRLPNFSRLAKMGRFSALGTSMPPQSPVAWSTFVTGLDPAQHGIFDFVHRDAATMTPYLSTTKTEPPRWMVGLFGWQVPLRAGRVTPLREGRPFWAALEAEGVRSTIVRMPANYPPSGAATRELSGMGTPDLLGTYGTFAFYTTQPFETDHVVGGGVIKAVRLDDDGQTIAAAIDGTPNPLRREPGAVTAAFTLARDPREPAARLTIGDESRVLKVGEWSDWVPVSFALAPWQSLRGMCRFYLRQVRPNVELYVTPINLDPLAPALPISTPASFAADLARATGRFYTQGMPEDTKALQAGVFDPDEFLRQAAFTASENMRQYALLLDQFHDGLLFHYFGHVDQVSHMMWRAMDPEHPAYNEARDGPYRHVVEDLYVGLDALVGRTMDRMPRDTLLIVMSDHGFASWRRAFHLNRWLEEQGYLAIRDPARRMEPMLADVDWTRTRAYGLGLNGLYINVKGREPSGIVDPAQREALAAEIGAALLATVDPANGQRVVTAVHRPSDAAAGVARPERAPDLIVGYAKGTRASNESGLGQIPPTLIEDNTGAWSGDHCMDPASVPGVLFTSRPLHQSASSLQDLSSAILAEFK